MCGLARRRRLLSQEAALKYFLLGAFSSAFFLYGIALLYGYAGSVRLLAHRRRDHRTARGASTGALLLLGIALLAVGLLFKVGAAPFHAWTPDVYQGAPTPVTGFMAACTKVAAFGALLRVVYVALPRRALGLAPVLWGSPILTMVVGSVIAIVQTDIKRMLAYSSIAHAGFILVGVARARQAGIVERALLPARLRLRDGRRVRLVTLVRDAGEDGPSSARRRTCRSGPASGAATRSWPSAFALFLLAFAGIPLTGGFIGKFAVFSAAVSTAAGRLALIGVLASAVAAFFYVR